MMHFCTPKSKAADDKPSQRRRCRQRGDGRVHTKLHGDVLIAEGVASGHHRIRVDVFALCRAAVRDGARERGAVVAAQLRVQSGVRRSSGTDHGGNTRL
jgi:hypothetical protein